MGTRQTGAFSKEHLKTLSRRTIRSIAALALVCFVPVGLGQSYTLRGRIVDAMGGVIAGATVAVADLNRFEGAKDLEKTTTTDDEGVYVITGLLPGLYTVKATAPGFALYERLLQISAVGASAVDLNIQLSVAVEKQEVTVETYLRRIMRPHSLLESDEVEALFPEDADDLEDVLQALAGPPAGPGGGQFHVDGFQGGRLPLKSSIKEIRVNQNPFSSEFDRLGFGRTEIATKPGTDRFRGQASMNFNDESLNSLNPFAPHPVPFQSRRYGGNFSGPILAKKFFFFVDFERREIEDNVVINATILDNDLNIIPFRQVVYAPQRRHTFSTRLDYKLNGENTLMVRYGLTRSNQENEGIGNLSLLSRASSTSFSEHNITVTETAAISPKAINETRFLYQRRENHRNAANTAPGLRVLDAFTGGGPQIGLSFNVANYWELQNITSWASGRHSVKMGGRLRAVHISDLSQSNFGGTFTFARGLGPQFDADNEIVVDADGKPVLIPITGVERYRRTLLFQQLGKTAEEVRALGGGATQFSIAAGNPEANVRQVDFGGFVQDSWRLRSDFILSLGLRYEVQTNISDNMDFAPRVAFVWFPATSLTSRPKTLLRGGFGVFYDRFGEGLTLDVARFNRIKQLVLSNPDFFPNVLSIADLQDAFGPQPLRRIADGLRSPYSMQSAISMERQLPFNATLTTSYINTDTLHVLGSRNINAPIPGIFQSDLPAGGLRPFGDIGEIFQYESGGLLKQNQLIVGLNIKFSRTSSLFADYTWSKANSNSDGPSSFPANSYDLSSEYGRAGFDVRHRFAMGGAVRMRWGVQLNPFVVASSGRPFNITTGRDTNSDGLFTDRPALTDPDKPGATVTASGAFDPNPAPGQSIIPRNFGQDPGLFLVNLRISKTLGFGAAPERNRAAASASSPEGGPPRGQRSGGAAVAGDGKAATNSTDRTPANRTATAGGSEGGELTNKPYTLMFSIQVQNIFNHTNFGPVMGSLGSPLFGRSNSILGGFGFREPGGGMVTGGKRRVELQLRFNF